MYSICKKFGKLILTHKIGKVYTVENHNEECHGTIYDPIEYNEDKCLHCGHPLISSGSVTKKVKKEKSFQNIYYQLIDITKGRAQSIPYQVLSINEDKYSTLVLKRNFELIEVIINRLIEKRERTFQFANKPKNPDDASFGKLKEDISEFFVEKFAPKEKPPKGLVIKSASEELGQNQNAVFAKRDLPQETHLGVFGGLIIQSLDQPELGQISKYYVMENVLEFEIFGTHFAYGILVIDPTRRNVDDDEKDPYDEEETFGAERYMSWNGILNHKPDFSRIISKYPNFSMPPEWGVIFSNVEIDVNLQMHLKRDVKSGEELTWDYGDAYWKESDLPLWDLEFAPKNFWEFIFDEKLPEEWDYENEFSQELKIQRNFDSKTIRKVLLKTISNSRYIVPDESTKNKLEKLF